jgi:hypothetical protein
MKKEEDELLLLFTYLNTVNRTTPRRYEGKKVVHEESIIVSEEIERIIIYAVL